jgi:multidrug efflux pump subunit AcrB
MIAIPVSLVATFAMMAAFGFSINTLTMCGLVLAIGLVVDDAIIVVENIEKFLERGMGPLEATRAAMAEITAPIVTIGLVLAAVFVPVAFIPGLTGRLYNQFALTIVFSLIFSAFNSLTFTPAIARIVLRPKHGETRFPPFRWFNRGLKWIEDSYDSFLDFGARHWWTIVFPSLGLLVLTGWLIYERPKAFIPTEDQGYLIVVMQTPDGTTREPTSRVAQRVGKIAGERSPVSSLAFATSCSSTATTPSPPSIRRMPPPHSSCLKNGPTGPRRGCGPWVWRRNSSAGFPSRSATRGWRSSSPRPSRG